MSSQALKHLQDVLAPNRPVVYTQPEMIPQWQPAYAQKLKQAVSAALNGGVAPEKVYKLLDTAASLDLDSLPDDLLASCLEAGLGPDTDMGGESLLHFFINTPFPIPLGQLDHGSSCSGSSSEAADTTAGSSSLQLDPRNQAALQRLQDLQRSIPAQHSPACGSVTLAELLRRGATPDLSDSSGNTALHMVVACMVSKKHFPDPRVGQQQQQQPQDQLEQDGTDNAAPDGSSKPAASTKAGAAADGAAAEPQRLNDHDAARAAYAAAAFRALLQAGWDPAVRNDNGYTVSDLILEGLSRYQTELSDLQDPEGVAQTTVALLSQRAPEKGLQQFLDDKIAGVQAVVDALLLMHRLAATVEAPRKRRSALGLIMLWLGLLLACVWWVYGRQRG